MSVENIVVDIEINNLIAPDIEQSIVATIDNNINVIKDDTDDLDVTINRKEYVITGDEIYIPKRYEDAPTWLQNMIDQVVEYSIGAKVSDMNQVIYSLNQMIEAMEVSKNTYEMSVISSNDIDTRINTAITTLNSNINIFITNLNILDCTSYCFFYSSRLRTSECNLTFKRYISSNSINRKWLFTSCSLTCCS